MNSVKEIDFKAIDKYLNGYTYLVLGITLVTFIVSVDRTRLLDNDNYINYFSIQNLFPDFFQQLSESESLVHAAAYVFSEEPLWMLYTQIVSSILSPELSVYFTVFLLNSIIVYSCSKFEYRITGLLIWILVPMGAAIIGLYQIRQGFAFSLLALFFARRWNLTVGALIATLVHTTFVIPFMIFLFLSQKIFRSRPLPFVLMFAMVCYFMASFATTSFDEFSGRRGGDYTVDQGASSINFVIGTLLLALPSLILVFDRNIQVMKSAMEISLMQVGLLIWLITCFFIFPVGTARIDYFPAIFSMFPILASGRDLWRKHPILMSAYALGVFLTIYAGVRDGKYINNTY